MASKKLTWNENFRVFADVANSLLIEHRIFNKLAFFLLYFHSIQPKINNSLHPIDIQSRFWNVFDERQLLTSFFTNLFLFFIHPLCSSSTYLPVWSRETVSRIQRLSSRVFSSKEGIQNDTNTNAMCSRRSKCKENFNHVPKLNLKFSPRKTSESEQRLFITLMRRMKFLSKICEWELLWRKSGVLSHGKWSYVNFLLSQ